MNPVSLKSVGILKNAMALYIAASIICFALAGYFGVLHDFRSAVICVVGAIVIIGIAYLIHMFLVKNQNLGKPNEPVELI